MRYRLLTLVWICLVAAPAGGLIGIDGEREPASVRCESRLAWTNVH
jgi:hypothetical protein